MVEVGIGAAIGAMVTLLIVMIWSHGRTCPVSETRGQIAALKRHLIELERLSGSGR